MENQNTVTFVCLLTSAVSFALLWISNLFEVQRLRKKNIQLMNDSIEDMEEINSLIKKITELRNAFKN